MAAGAAVVVAVLENPDDAAADDDDDDEKRGNGSVGGGWLTLHAQLGTPPMPTSGLLMCCSLAAPSLFKNMGYDWPGQIGGCSARRGY